MEEQSEGSYHPSFECCICLDLLFKPVVLACGHLSCFWCVHKAMHGVRASHCAICRQPYIHFPSVCQLLHLLVSKMEPVAYKRREKEVLEEEKRVDIFSPQFNYIASENICSEGKDSGVLRNIAGSFMNLENRTNISKEVSLQQNGSKNEIFKYIFEDIVLCALCQKLLFQPTVLNCGHVFCKPCLSRNCCEAPLKCHVCQSIHPGEFPKICLNIEDFLEEQFPNEYATRREELRQLENVKLSSEGPSFSISNKSHNTKPSKNINDDHIWMDENIANVNIGVGCDYCGMYPIIGNRYRCKDCKEAMGFDLCESCYKTSSKLPGRFNQQHTPDHQFELNDSRMLHKILLLRSPSMENPYRDLSEDYVSLDEGDQNDEIVGSADNDHSDNGFPLE